DRVRELLTGKTEHVKSVEFVSKEEAYQQERKKNPEAYALLGSNPLPDLFRVTPDDPDNLSAIIDELSPQSTAGARTPVDPAIDVVKDKKDNRSKLLTITRVVKIVGGGLAILLVIASILLISNTIRLSMFSRRREV